VIGFCFSVVGCGDLAIPLATPNITQVLPRTLTAGSKTQTMKVVGTNFTNTAVILWNGSSLATSVVDSNTLVGTVESSSLAVPAVVQLKVQIRQTGRESQAMPVTVASASSVGSPNVPPVTAPLVVSTTQVPSGIVGNVYSTPLAATGGTGAYTWSLTSGALPRGLTLAASTGVISGTPVASGTSSFTIRVTDSGNPAQTASAVESIAVAASGASSLTITTLSLPSGTEGTAYARTLQASGGTPAYTWSITSGNLPAGLTLAATTGVISGTPNTVGTSNFTVKVSDNGNPVQTKSVATSITVSSSASIAPGPGTTWYIRPDGGTRYSANAPTGQCDGKADASYASTGGTGVNQHCAFGDYRYLWDDQSYGNYGWVISGGDTVILRGGPWRVGYDQGESDHDVWCRGNSNAPYGCVNPPIPAGTATQHTRILGENYASCGSSTTTNRSMLTQIFGGHGVWNALNLNGAQYVDVECLEITRHSQCTIFGVPSNPAPCNKSYPIDDYDTNGISTDVNTHDVLMQDMWIHGHPSRGIIGPIGGTVTCLRCDIAFNGGAGWDFDDGKSTASVNGVWNFNYSTIEWNGCNQEYPMVDPIPAISCYGQSDGGYGDGVGTPTGSGMSANVDHSTFRYNTQDGLDMLHVGTGQHTLTITNSTSYGNNGAAIKLGSNMQSTVITSNLILANCHRLAAPMPGAPSDYNAHLNDFCRASDAVPFNFRQGGNTLIANNTFVTYAPTTFDIGCGDASCSDSTLTFKNNIVLAYQNSQVSDYGGSNGPGLFYYSGQIGHIIRSNNIYFGVGHNACPPAAGTGVCTDPLLVNEPIWTGESSLDNFDFDITAGSPAKGAGTPILGLLLDYTGLAWGSTPSIGAYQE